MSSSKKVWVRATTSVMPLISENAMLNHWTKIVVVAKQRGVLMIVLVTEMFTLTVFVSM